MLTKLNNNSERILDKRYYLEGEDWPILGRRVTESVVPISCSQYKYTKKAIKKLTLDCFGLINGLFFLPNSPTMFNAGTEHPMLSACFIIDVEDDLPSIYDSVKESAIIHKMGGGVGLCFGKLRSNGSKIATTQGHTRGAVAFIRVFSAGTEEITAAGKRRGANMGQLPVWHYDVLELCTCKSQEGVLENFNLTVQLTDDFMLAVKEDADFNLYDPKDMSIRETVKARELMKMVVRGAWLNGEPGVCFIDRINGDNPTPHLGKITSSNPCQPGWAPVLTPEGIRTFDDIDVGSIIWSGKKWTEVVRKEFTGVKDVYGYHTVSGSVFYGTKDHRVLEYGKKVSVEKANYIDMCSLDGAISIGHENKIIKIEYRGAEPVYDITVLDDEHTYWTDGLLVSNCGEYYSIPYNSCNLGSLNLTKYVEEGGFNWSLLEKHIELAVHYLDCVIDANEYPLEKIDKVSKSTRPLGLGVMGFADALIMMNIKYDSEEGFSFAEKLSEFLSYKSLEASMRLAKIRGSYPEFRAENHLYKKYTEHGSMDWAGLVENIQKYGLRNSHTVVIAPTGTIASIANEVSHGIEPVFQFSYERNIMDEVQVGRHWLYEKFINGELGVDKEVFVVAEKISWQDHIEMQARWQKYTHNGISKTINMPEYVTEEDVYSAFMLAHEKGLKGLTVYVSGSRKKEVIVKEGKEVFDQHSAPKRSDILECDIINMQVSGEKWLIFVGLMNGKPYEIFAGLSKYVDLPKKYDKGHIVKRYYKTKPSEYDLVINKDTEEELRIKNIVETFSNENEAVLGRVVSLSLRHGAATAHISEQLLKDPSDDFYSYSKCLGRVLKRYIQDGERPETDSVCPECGSWFVYQEGCKICLSCGFGKCN